ncbi:unnamed protein product [Litomosoides sigmodontis]|uniref:Geminin n=1 Tax=Litomosoides sigmodontis TaxID=42156 RepID=A0A3P6SZA2_LITSI|nr:unnamed protein product [Litomosoides sigmodontis]
MPGGTLCQVQNISTHATRKAGELKISKATTNIKDSYEHSERKIGKKNIKNVARNSTGDELKEMKVVKPALQHEKPNTVEAAVQTDVRVSTDLPNLTVEDLRSSKVSANYWRRLAERLCIENEEKAKINFELSIHLAKISEEIAEEEEDYLALKHYISDEENAERLKDSEFNETENAKREDEVNSSNCV